jgi:hypothetical protein
MYNLAMLTGKRFRLKTAALGIETIDENEENKQAVSVPAGEIVSATGGPRPDDKRLVDVLWCDKKLVMFYQDIQNRGEQVAGAAGRQGGARHDWNGLAVFFFCGGYPYVVIR